jgi:phenylalanine-4-hydroxylase
MASFEKPNSSDNFLDRLPDHLEQFIVPQNYAQYTAMDQAVWRFVMRKNTAFLKTVAHESYCNGLEQAGISIDTIPNIYGMNRILKKIGWAAVAVDGFIPPNAFMEFQANKILVIASDIRQLEHIEYTPAPDIIHEASGHAPIIANPDYAEFLRRLGEIGSKAILSKQDVTRYEAVRQLSILKAMGTADKKKIKDAESVVKRLQEEECAFSEMAQVRNMQWWSVEYGLVGSLESPKIYGAGLLSSIGESAKCLGPEVKKIPYSLDVINMGFDITKPQPQLYVTPDFAYLMEVLEAFADTLSVRVGGYSGLQKLINSESVGTIELNTGLQISGVFSRVILNEKKEVIYFKTSGATALAYREKELVGHGVSYHKDGYSSPLGMLKNINLPLENMSVIDLKAYDFYDGKQLSFEFESGIKVNGINITGMRNITGKIMIIQLSNCTVTYKEEVLFKPEFGVFDMAIGSSVVSAFAGAADPNSFPNLYRGCKPPYALNERTNDELNLNLLAQKIRGFRSNLSFSEKGLEKAFNILRFKWPDNWLLALELLELSKSAALQTLIKKHLSKLVLKKPNLKALIKSGIMLIKKTIYLNLFIEFHIFITC